MAFYKYLNAYNDNIQNIFGISENLNRMFRLLNEIQGQKLTNKQPNLVKMMGDAASSLSEIANEILKIIQDINEPPSDNLYGSYRKSTNLKISPKSLTNKWKYSGRKLNLNSLNDNFHDEYGM